ncbi:MAG: AraC family transcriptional regulator [Clostridia bacterium]|nr:AraC family transcriptional regulator [Clostridia bacterium]
MPRKYPVTGTESPNDETTTENTEQAGYIRSGTGKEPRKDNFQRITEYMEAHYNEQISLQDVASYAYLNRTYVSELFPKKLGMSFTSYRNLLRIRHACVMMEKSSMSLTEISRAVGYDALSSFSRVFRQIMGVPPQQYRKTQLKAKTSAVMMQIRREKEND